MGGGNGRKGPELHLECVDVFVLLPHFGGVSTHDFWCIMPLERKNLSWKTQVHCQTLSILGKFETGSQYRQKNEEGVFLLRLWFS